MSIDLCRNIFIQSVLNVDLMPWKMKNLPKISICFKMVIGYDRLLVIEEVSKWQTTLLHAIGHFARQIMNHPNHLIKWILRHCNPLL